MAASMYQWLCPGREFVNMRLLLLISVFTTVSMSAHAQDAPTWEEVGALFRERCTICHSGDGAPLGLQLDTLEHALTGSINGPVLLPGDPAGSELIRRLKGESQPRMPLTGPPFLDEGQIAMVERWIEAGMPAGDAAEAGPATDAGMPAGEAAATGAEPEPMRPGPGAPVTFAHVEPIFLQRCAKCHKSEGIMGAPPEGLRLDTYANIIESGERLALVPGKPELSEIVRRIEGTAEPRMPFDGPPWLEEQDIRLIRQWIEQGAPNAEGNPAPVPIGREVRYRGRLTGEREIDGAGFIVDGGTRIDDRPRVGDEAEVRGVISADGSVRATRLRSR